jgi:N-acetylmuramoyl-L-alanine amidase
MAVYGLISLQAAALAVLLFTSLPTGSAAGDERKKIYWGRAKKVVVLDPGHGGADAGARSPDGSVEKDIALNLSRLIAVELSGLYLVKLTRSEDYGLALEGRTDIANNLKGDAFVSIHAGGSFNPAPGGITIFCYSEIASEMPILPVQPPGIADRWDQIQLKHKGASHLLARHLKDRLDPIIGAEVLDAPLRVLQGADMPAVLIEVGYLTNLEDAKILRDDDRIKDISRAVAGSIEAFFEDLRRK